MRMMMYGRFSITGMSDTKECRNSILFTASECVPFVKTGGLADVVGALPKEFDSKYWDIRVVLPCYTCIPDKFKNQFKHIGEFNMQLGDKTAFAFSASLSAYTVTVNSCKQSIKPKKTVTVLIGTENAFFVLIISPS